VLHQLTTLLADKACCHDLRLWSTHKIHISLRLIAPSPQKIGANRQTIGNQMQIIGNKSRNIDVKNSQFLSERIRKTCLKDGHLFEQ